MQTHNHSPRILLVEDDVDDRYMMYHGFHEIGADDMVKMFTSGEELMQYLHQLPDATNFPSLIVLDYNMPGINGADVLTRLKSDELLKNIPVIVYSSVMKPLISEALKIKGAILCCEKGSNKNDFTNLAIQFKSIAIDHSMVS